MQRAIKASVKLQRRTNSVEVPQCPVFRPTPDEFADPFAYIKSITPEGQAAGIVKICLLYTSPSPRDRQKSRMPSSA